MALAFSASDEEKWLTSEPEWTSRLGDGWRGVKFLGKGSGGIAGLWEYHEDGEHDPTALRKVVVKQSEATQDWDQTTPLGPKTPFDEGSHLVELRKLGSKHIFRQYGGNRISDDFGEMGKVVRIFLEYCPGGDLGKFVGEPDNPKPLEKRLLEVDIWAMFYCLALGLTVMDRGTEDYTEPRWNGFPKETELVHFDIKPDNSEVRDHYSEYLLIVLVFLGHRDSEHPRMPTAKAS